MLYVRTRVVGPGATPLLSGAALRAAMEAIPAGQDWLLQLEPGLYDLGTTGLTLEPGVHLRGSGDRLTVVSSSAEGPDSGTLMVVNRATVSALHVRNVGGNGGSTALHARTTGLKLHDVTVTASGGTSMSTALMLYDVQGTLHNVRAYALSPDYANALRCYGCTATFTDSQFEARGGRLSVGVYAYGATVRLRGATALGENGEDNWGVYADTDMVLEGVRAEARGGLRGTGLFVGEGNVRVHHGELSSVGATERNDALGSFTNFANYGQQRTITVESSVLTGASASASKGRYFDIRLAHSRLAGPLVQSDTVTGRFTCLGTYDESFAARACP